MAQEVLHQPPPSSWLMMPPSPLEVDVDVVGAPAWANGGSDSNGRPDAAIRPERFARLGDDATLFRLAAQLEAAQPWNARRPPVWSGLATAGRDASTIQSP